MEHYIRISVLLCIYGVFKEFRPAEPYIVPYMTGPPLNFTAEQVNHDIFPVSTYSTMGSLIIIFLITDFLRYKIIIIMQAICMIVAFVMLIFGRGVFQMQIEEIFYGLHMAGEVAYFTYIYAKVDKNYFQEVTSHTRSAYLVGKCLCGIVAQGIVSYNVSSYQGLLWITIASQVIALIWAILLPSVDKSIYFHRNVSEEDKTDLDTITKMHWWMVVSALTIGAMVMLGSAREAKWFLGRGTVTRYVHKQHLETQVVPSSCVVVESLLKPCRHLRQIQPSPVHSQPRIKLTASPRLDTRRASPAVMSSEGDPEDTVSWGSYLGLGSVTVTHTLTETVTQRQITPAAVVTFSVRGCRPSHLPFDLELCPVSHTLNTSVPHFTASASTTKDLHFAED